MKQYKYLAYVPVAPRVIGAATMSLLRKLTAQLLMATAFIGNATAHAEVTNNNN